MSNKKKKKKRENRKQKKIIKKILGRMGKIRPKANVSGMKRLHNGLQEGGSSSLIMERK